MGRLWEAYLRVSGWKSEYQSVSNLLRYLKYRKIGSEASRNYYGRTVYAFCRYTGKLPDELEGLKKTDIEKLVEEFCYHKKESGCSSRTVNAILSNLKTFFKTNGFKGMNELEVESYYQPSRARTRREYIPTLDEVRSMANVAGSLRDRAMILFMVSTGLRNSTQRAVLYGEIKEELEKGSRNILIRVHAGMKKVVPTACKGNIEYFVFTSEEATETLQLYLGHRRSRFGEIGHREFLFPSKYNRVPHRERVFKPLTGRELQVIIKKCARKAGIKEWMNVTPHCLRKTFESVLRSRLADGGRLDLKTQEYFMGHILAGSMDTYFDKSKVDEMRKEYSGLVFTPYDKGKFEASDLLRVIAEALGVDLVRLVESKKTELGRHLTNAEEVRLLQEELKRVIHGLKEGRESDVRTPFTGEPSEQILGTQGSPSIGAQPPQRLTKKQTRTMSESRENEKGSRVRSPQLTSYMSPQESEGKTTQPSVNNRQRAELKSDVQTKLLSFSKSTS